MIFSKNKNEQTQSRLINIFNALGDQTRYKLLSLLQKKDDICVSELANEVGISNAGVSQQLKILEQAGLVIRKRQGQKICYQVNSTNEINKKLLKLID